MTPDYYAILEVSPTATPAEIKRSYRRLVRKYHPDLNKEALDQHIKQLNEAYRVLSKPARRAAYDELRAAEQRYNAAQQAVRRQRYQPEKGPRMTWAQGIAGFVRELRKALRED